MFRRLNKKLAYFEEKPTPRVLEGVDAVFPASKPGEVYLLTEGILPSLQLPILLVKESIHRTKSVRG